jgi:hypothetical protein
MGTLFNWALFVIVALLTGDGSGDLPPIRRS